MTSIDELLNSIFDDPRPSLYDEFEGWVRSSRRFRAFADINHGKIRAKLKRVSDAGGMQDLRAELETAALLLREERFTLTYEKYAATKQRGPDYTVTYKTHTPFNVEVRRIHSLEMEGTDTDARTVKLMTVLCEKLGQMPPSIVNLLWLTSEHALSVDDLNRAITVLRQLADTKNNDFFTKRGFPNIADFNKQFQRLSGIVMHRTGENVVWVNALGKHKVPPEIMAAVRRLGGG